MRKIYFLFGIHNHQPVGNFPEVLERGYQECYKPFIEVIARHPKIKWSLHCTGILWDFFVEKHPEYIEAVKKMSKTGQVELVTGGYYEPIMPAIPDRDKIGQILKHKQFIKDTFDCNARGMWLAERVWEPYLAKPFAEAGIEYTVVDDTHFAASGMDPEKLRGYYVSEEQGSRLNIFPISELLRYSMPFHTVEQNVEYFRSFARESGNPAIVMFDDGEKFGMWPGTNKHSYQDKWLENFFNMLDHNRDWIETITFSEYIDKFGPDSRAYLPAASYLEMSEWALPSDTQEVFESTVKRFKDDNSVKRFLKGGFWRNFLTKYPESNNMHKKMLHLSEKVNDFSLANPDSAAGKKAVDALYAGQCNCAYWHGVFGGLYLPHLRNGIFNSLITADRLLAAEGVVESKWHEKDFDCDGNNELLYEDKRQNIYAAPNSGGSIFEWDLLARGLNIMNVLTRRKEAYHRKLREFLANPENNGSGVKSIHDLVQVKEANLDKYLNYDWYRRTSLLDHFPHPATKFDDFSMCRYGEQGDFVLGKYTHKIVKNSLLMTRTGTVWCNDKPYTIKIEKSITPDDGEGFKVQYSLSNLSKESAELVFAPEFNFGFSGDKRKENGELLGVTKWSRLDEPFSIELDLKMDTKSDLWVFAVETVSLSEYGFERTYQGTGVLNLYRVMLNPEDTKVFNIDVNLGSIKTSASRKQKRTK